MTPGEYLLRDEPVELNEGRARVRVQIENTGDRPIQVGSHTHFFEVNRALRFSRTAAYGHHLDIPAGTSLRFEPGERREVTLVPFAGTRSVFGMNGLVNGPLDARREDALQQIAARGFLDQP